MCFNSVVLYFKLSSVHNNKYNISASPKSKLKILHEWLIKVQAANGTDTIKNKRNMNVPVENLTIVIPLFIRTSNLFTMET